MEGTVAQTRITVHEFAREWVERYRGTGRRAFRENTRTEYRRLLNAYALRFFSQRKRLTEATPRDLAQFVAWLADEKAQGKRLSDSSIANAAVPLRAMFATAVREGLLRHNPASNLALPHRPKIEEEDDEEVRPLSRQQLADRQVNLPGRSQLRHYGRSKRARQAVLRPPGLLRRGLGCSRRRT
jgi:site-specific recombinase XerD